MIPLLFGYFFFNKLICYYEFSDIHVIFYDEFYTCVYFCSWNFIFMCFSILYFTCTFDYYFIFSSPLPFHLFTSVVILFVNSPVNLPCVLTAQCRTALGMQSGAIPDSAITASSSYDEGTVGPQYSR